MKPRTVMMLAIVATLLATLTMLAFADPGFAATLNVMNANVTSGVTGHGVDQPFGAVKVCVPGSTTQCQVVSGLLIDTGSYGLRIFSQALTVHLPVEMSGPDRIGECAFFGSGTAWGRVATADVAMGDEPTIQNLPVQIISTSFPTVGHIPAGCHIGPPFMRSPQQSNFNGILGVGLRQYDGVDTFYYACTTTTCAGITQPLESQVQNPVALLPVDNNGVVLNLPQPPTNGASRLTGHLIFGINTQSNNMIPSGFQVYTADGNLQFKTLFQGNPRLGFIDSGSNGFFYYNPHLPVCTSQPWYCPATLTAQSATNTGSDSNSSGLIIFDIANAHSLFETSNAAFSDLGANAVPSYLFDWGLPFFLGRKIFVGIEGKTISGVSESPPFWAFKAN